MVFPGWILKEQGEMAIVTNFQRYRIISLPRFNEEYT